MIVICTTLNQRRNLNFNLLNLFVASPGIEPGLRASETLVLSIVLQGLYNVCCLLFIVQLSLSISFFKNFAFKFSTFSNTKPQTTNNKHIFLLPKILNIGAEYFHRNGQQYHPKKFTHHN